jgi:hypothetical protein
MAEEKGRNTPRRLQLHLVLPYKFDPIEDHKVRGYLEQGYRVEQLQRVSDREALVTLVHD